MNQCDSCDCGDGEEQLVLERLVVDVERLMKDVIEIREWKENAENVALDLSHSLSMHVTAIQSAVPIPPIQRLAVWTKAQLARLRQHIENDPRNGSP